MSTPKTMTARRAAIATLLHHHHVNSQEHLRTLLIEQGFDVTQATVSRDLDELGAIKITDAGDTRYVIAGEPTNLEDGMNRVARLAGEMLIAVESSANIVVLRTPPGAAQYLASAIDHASDPSIIGTVAGDDTVLLVTRDSHGGDEVARRFLAFAESHSRVGDTRTVRRST